MTTFAARLGAVVSDGGVSFRVWAPAAREIAVVLDGRDVSLDVESDGYFSAAVSEARAGQRYWFRVNGELRPDPASRFQPEGPLGPSEIVDPRRYAWSDQHWPGSGPAHRHVFYEMHIGTFTREGSWAAAEHHLPYLADLGITTIEVMPIAEFAGRFGWGYDGVDWFAPSRLYGTPDDARHFVDAAHKNGLAVILDVVYNHLGPVGNFLAAYSDTYFGNPGDWGDCMNYDGPGSHGPRSLVTENAAYWIAEYHFDGLRMDATHGIHDSSPEHIVSEMSRAARGAAGSRTIFIAAENEPQDVRLLRNTGPYEDGVDAIWNEDWHHSAFVALTGHRAAYFTDYEGTAPEFAAMGVHGFLYQGQWYSWQKNTRGGYSSGLPARCFVSFLENHDQVANTGTGRRTYVLANLAKWRAMTALLLLGPQLPLLFQGQEFASSQPFTYFADHAGELGEAVRKGRLEFLAQFPNLKSKAVQGLIPNPRDENAFDKCKLRHEERAEHGETLALHRDLLHLRQHDAVFSRLGTDEIAIQSATLTRDVMLLRYQSTHDDRLVIVNLGADYVSPMNNPLFAARPGIRWELAWTSDDHRYNGRGAVPLSDDGRWLLPGFAAIVLNSSKSSAPVQKGEAT